MNERIDLSSGWEFLPSKWLAEPPTYVQYPGWMPATIPGYVHLDLVANGIIRHPFEELAENGCQWVDEEAWTYRKRFDWNGGNRDVRLRFEGLDTICTVSLNGRQVAENASMFLPLTLEVGDTLKPGTNELVVEFKSAAQVGRRRRAEYFEREGIAPDVKNFDERAFVRKAQYMFGWDWGPRLVSCGIWKPVWLEVGPGEESQVQPQSPPRVRLRREPDTFGESFELIVDGEPFWARGANWIPIHSFPSETGALRSRLEGCKRMRMNMLRVWGGGLYESEEFYDLCDELDLLVWQDFPFACSYSPDDERFVEEIRREATYHVQRLRRHRCLALWCGNNENLTMWEGKWGGAERNPDRLHGERIWNEVLAEVVAEHDPGRPYLPTSPIGSPPGVENCNAGDYGDSHYWDVWHGRGDWVHYADSTARFSSEFGFPSSCGPAAWREVTETPPDRLLPNSPMVRGHDKTGRPFEYLRDLICLHYPEPRNLEDWIYFSQLNQRDAMRFAVEHYRRSEFCKGTLIWQLNDCWPVQSWSLMDSAGDWKLAAHELTRVYADILICLHHGPSGAEIWGINDSSAKAEVVTDFRAIHSLSGVELGRHTETVSLESHSRRILGIHPVDGYDPRETILNVNGGAYLLCEPKDLRLNPEPLLTYDSGALASDVPLLDLTLPGGYRNLLLPGERWSVPEIAGPVRSLAGVHEGIKCERAGEGDSAISEK